MSLMTEEIGRNIRNFFGITSRTKAANTCTVQYFIFSGRIVKFTVHG
jgi:hypothetical protein